MLVSHEQLKGQGLQPIGSPTTNGFFIEATHDKKLEVSTVPVFLRKSGSLLLVPFKIVHHPPREFVVWTVYGEQRQC